jgi:hypothetical protein
MTWQSFGRLGSSQLGPANSAPSRREGVRWAALLWTLGFALLLTGCEPSSIRWTEDVRLNDGRVVTVERFVEFNGPPPEPFKPRSQSRLELAFKHPNSGARVEWIGERIYSPIALFVRNDEMLLLVGVAFGGWEQLNCPDPGFILWGWREGVWSRLQLEELPIRYVIPNLTTSAARLKASGRVHWWHGLHITVEETTNPEKYQDVEPVHFSFEKLERQTFGTENCRAGRGQYSQRYAVYPMRRKQ